VGTHIPALCAGDAERRNEMNGIIKGEAMKMTTMIIFLTLLGGTLGRADIRVAAVKGAVYVRHNVQEEWTPVSRGDVLKPDDSMKSGGKSSASLLVDGKTTVVLPEMAIIDLSDLRTLTKEDLLLKLAMERIRRIPAKQNDEEISIPRATTTHGADMDTHAAAPASDPQVAFMQMKGAEVLFGNGFYETGVLRAKGLFRIHPELSKRIDDRLMVARALEKLELKGEALEEYVELGTARLGDHDRAVVKQKIEELRGAR
jgi:hypothetical protein